MPVAWSLFLMGNIMHMSKYKCNRKLVFYSWCVHRSASVRLTLQQCFDGHRDWFVTLQFLWRTDFALTYELSGSVFSMDIIRELTTCQPVYWPWRSCVPGSREARRSGQAEDGTADTGGLAFIQCTLPGPMSSILQTKFLWPHWESAVSKIFIFVNKKRSSLN